jgi:hypothetical protein
MNPLLARFLRSVYRREPLSGFILVLGVTDILLGGIGGRWSLLSVGLVIALTGMLLRWRHTHKIPTTVVERPARQLLPPSPSSQPLPLLTSDKRRR